MALNRGIGSTKYMTKRTPKNEKYDHVKTKLDTGSSLTKHKERLEEIRRNYKYRKNEIFKRLKATTFAHLVLQVASISDMTESENDTESHIPAEDVLSSVDSECVSERPGGSALSLPLSDHEYAEETESCYSARSTLLSVISGVGERCPEHNNQKTTRKVVDPSKAPYPDCPYLLLDVRYREKYDSCHIISAHSFPMAMLSRSVNPYTKEILQYKNAKGKIIIVYDEDELIASQVATMMCQRGFENVFLLSGGLRVIAQKFPCGLTTGSIPASPPSSKVKRRPTSQKPPMAAEKRWRFTLDELAKIQEQLEEILMSSDTSSCLSSRMSTASTRFTSSAKSSVGGSSRHWK
ncbi:centrosomal protein of 41 kDa [Gouania willdenowi]|uniref:Rhodanese domain-containing protein n=1 Tax=Gouania willdenowi TaxID=441366 RepID=A0A8C5E044_GOUWI|nr:centrosomal protein of 41 kDa [Gouania willdenowi]